jgi:predicted MFS family arabinose efflux permease
MALNMTILWSLLYSCVIYFVDEQHLGMAYGIVSTGIGFGECFGPVINAFWL